MKILFIADHHIKLGQKNVPKQWARNRFNLLWEAVDKVCRETGTHTIMHGGDIFDRVPTPEEVGIMLDMFDRLKDYTHIVYAGNHEATSKHKSFWEEFSALEADGNITLIHEFTELEPGVHVLPYTDLKKKDWHGTEGRILFTHVRGEIPPHVKPEIDLDLFNTWDKVFAGDLHARSNSQRNIYYPGSPITTSFHRSESSNENGCYIVDTCTMVHEFIEFKLPQLIRRTVDNPDDMVQSDYHHTIYELLGDATELATVGANDLLDKKIISRDSEATLQLKDMTMEEELLIYLTEVEKLNKPEEVVEEYVNIKNSVLE